MYSVTSVTSVPWDAGTRSSFLAMLNWISFIWILALSPEGCDLCCGTPVIFMFMRLADTFIQNDLQCIQVIHFFCQYICDGAELIDQLFGQNKPFFSTFVIYVCFVENAALSVWLASVWLIFSCDYSDWMRAITMNANRPLWTIWPVSYNTIQYNTIQIKLGWALFVTYTIIQNIMRSEMCSLHLPHPSVHTWSSGQPTVQRPNHINMIIICITPHISVWSLTNSNQCECLAISVYVWQSEYVLHTKLFFSFFLFITQIILIVFFSGQINHLYDV